MNTITRYDAQSVWIGGERRLVAEGQVGGDVEHVEVSDDVVDGPVLELRDGTELLVRQVLELPCHHDAGIIDEDIDAAETIYGGVDDSCRCAIACDVSNQRRDTVGIGKSLIEVVTGNVDRQNVGAVIGKYRCNRMTDAVAGTGHNRALATQL